MNTLLKSLGAIILLIGVAVLAIPAFTTTRSNTVLAIGLFAVILGFILHILLNRKFE
ncbi:MAG: hypothetical protein LBT42_01095 [Tannerella sp.]|jgi:uncharacterized membrane protein HdeD (DUF308 family)|nr:hypothetical protein [Tannerella sp.]